MMREIRLKAVNGLAVLLGLSVLEAVALWQVIAAANASNERMAIFWIIVLVLGALGLAGLFMVQPNDGKALMLFGRYVGTVRDQGLWWANPFYSKKRISLRVRNFETGKLKVNDSHSNPIEIAAVVVWKVVDTAEALFEVDDYQHFVQTQSEAAVRALAQTYPYDAHTPGEVALSTHPAEV